MLNKLLEIQKELKVPKTHFNAFGDYNYRNAEDILEAVKPLCAKHKVVLTLSDKINQGSVSPLHIDDVIEDMLG